MATVESDRARSPTGQGVAACSLSCAIARIATCSGPTSSPSSAPVWRPSRSGLLAYDLAGADAGAFLGTALAIKMVAYVGVAPIADAFLGTLPRRTVLVTMDLVRAGVAVSLPWVDQIWQVYVLIFVPPGASAAFTPHFSGDDPGHLPDEREYTTAQSLSRLAYDLEKPGEPQSGAGRGLAAC